MGIHANRPSRSDGPRVRKSPDQIRSARSTTRGAPLGLSLLSEAERAFHVNFSEIRIHEDHEAHRHDTTAMTRGSHIHFAPGRFRPNSTAGRQLLGHELAHVVQQRQGRVSASGTADNVNRDSHLEQEANDAGSRFAVGSSVGTDLTARPQFPVTGEAQSSPPAQLNGGNEKKKVRFAPDPAVAAREEHNAEMAATLEEGKVEGPAWDVFEPEPFPLIPLHKDDREGQLWHKAHEEAKKVKSASSAAQPHPDIPPDATSFEGPYKERKRWSPFAGWRK